MPSSRMRPVYARMQENMYVVFVCVCVCMYARMHMCVHVCVCVCVDGSHWMNG